MYNGEFIVVKNRYFYGIIIMCFFFNNDLIIKYVL